MGTQLLRHVGVGFGAWGKLDAKFIEDTGRALIHAVSDEDERNLKIAAECFPKARLYADWHEMLDKEKDDYQSVSITTRDHMHASVAMKAIEMGKHVFCQKPLTRQIYEARRVTEAAKAQGVVTQMGIQIHSHEAYRTAVAAIRQGLIGKVREVHAWSKESSVHPDMNKIQEVQATPAALHWDNWLGVAPFKPFKQLYLYTWNGWMDFGNGILGNVACHIFDPIVTSLKLGQPGSVVANVSQEWADIPLEEKQTWPRWEIIRWVFDSTPYTTNEPFILTWYDGGKLPPVHLTKGEQLPSESGSILIGEYGNMILPHIQMPILLPREKFAYTELPKKKSEDHYKQYVNSCLGEGATSCGFDYSGPLTEIVLLGMLAVRFPDKKLQWDSISCRVSNHDPANEYLMRPYRKEWQVPALEYNFGKQ